MKPKVSKLLSLRDSRLKHSSDRHQQKRKSKRTAKSKALAEPVPQISSTTMFFNYNLSLGPPFRVICDTNFINFSIKNKLDVTPSMMDCLLAKCIPMVTECVIAELQKLGAKYRVALRIVKQEFETLPCTHKGTYADDCLVNRVQQHKCYIVATCDRALKRRIRKIPGIPIMYIVQRQYAIERMPDSFSNR